MTICKYCDTAHPKDEIANPNYCIARMEETIERLKSEVDHRVDQVFEIDRLLKAVWNSEAEIERLRADKAEYKKDLEACNEIIESAKGFAEEILSLNREIEDLRQGIRKIADADSYTRQIAWELLK